MMMQTPLVITIPMACTKTAMKLKGSTKTCRYLRVKFFKDFVIRLKGCIFVDLRKVYI